MAERFRLTAELRKNIVGSIRAGGYPHVAAEAAGVPKDVFDDWLAQGNRKNAWEPFRSFARDVRQAFAQARLLAEIMGYQKNPKVWLVNGPGRESDQRPGWSTSVKPAEPAPEARNALCDPELLAVLRKVRDVLEEFPEARQKVADALANLGVKTAKETSHGTKSV